MTVIRKDQKVRILGDKSYIGDQEIIGKLRVRDRNFNIIYEFDPDTNTVTVYDTDGNVIWQTDALGGNITGIPREYYLPLMFAGASGGGFSSFYTNMTVAQNLWPSRFTIDPDDFLGANFYLEAVYRAGSGGAEPTRTFNMDLYDKEAGAVVANSLIQGSEQSDGSETSYPLVRGSVNFRPYMISGNRTYVLRYYKSDNDDPNDFIDLYEARLIIKYG